MNQVLVVILSTEFRIKKKEENHIQYNKIILKFIVEELKLK